MRIKVIDPVSLACATCAAEPGVPCRITLAPEVGPLSIKWHHRARQEAAE